MVSALFVILLIFKIVTIFFRKAFCETCEKEDIVPTLYNKLRAPEPQGEPTHVYVFMHIMDLDEIEEATMLCLEFFWLSFPFGTQHLIDFRIHFFLGELWKDHRLCLKQYQDKKMNILAEEHFLKIWKPDMIFENAKQGEIVKLSVPNTFVKVLPDGSLYRATRYNLRTTCRMNLQNYPMDTQCCSLSIASLSHPASSMDLHWVQDHGSPYSDLSENIRFVGYVKPLKFDVQPPESVRYVEEWVSGNFTYLVANFTFIRSISSHVVNTYIPSTLVVIMSWLSFWLDVSVAPGRVTLGVTSLLTLATQGTRARNNLPPVSYMTALDIWLFICVLMVFASLVEYAIAYHIDSLKPKEDRKATPVRTVNRNYPRSHNIRRIPSSITPSITSSIMPERSGKNKKSSLLEKWKNYAHSKIIRYQKTNNKLDVFSRIAFPLFFSLFAVTYWGYYYGFKSVET